MAIALVLLVGAAATALAVRRSSQTIAAFGILGGLLAPAFAGADYDGATVALLLAATVPAAAVLVAQRWDAIALGAFAVTAPQLGLWLVGTPATAPTLLALSAFGALWIAQAVGFELRTSAPTLRPISAFLLTLDALVVAGAGAAVLLSHHDSTATNLWLFGLAAAHLAVGLATQRLPRVSQELGLLALSLGVVLADVALASTLDGAALPVAYAAGAIVFAGFSRTLPGRQADHLFVRAGLGGHVLLAASHALIVDASPAGAIDTSAAALALSAVAAASFTAARVGSVPRVMRAALDVTALAAIGWLAALTLDPLPLALAWAAQAAALAQVWRRSRDAVAHAAAWTHLALAAAVALVWIAPPAALADGLDDPLAAALALGALSLAMVRAGRVRLALPAALFPASVTDLPIAYAAAAVTALYAASTLVVTALGPHAGQVALSGLWAVLGVAALVGGLLAKRTAPRRAGLALLVLSMSKVFLVDLATLDSAARAGSFLAVGTLLLGAAAAWHRFAPRPREEPVPADA
ncbi:MAG TPA: DUF2339 domain-containing protein [Baekduia sp.]